MKLWAPVCALLFGCGPDPATEWIGTFELQDYRLAALAEPTTTTLSETPTSGTPTGTSPPTSDTVDPGCDQDLAPGDWGSAGFVIDLGELSPSYYLSVRKCNSPSDCDAEPWIAGGTDDLGPNGGTGSLAATTFVASSLSGGTCELFWWDLTFTGSPDSPTIAFEAASNTVSMVEGDALDCEAKLNEDLEHNCTGKYQVSGKRW